MKRTKRNKLLALLLAIAIVLIMLPTMVFAEDVGNQCIITNAEELKSVVSQVNAGDNFEGKTICLQSDIALNPGYTFEFDADSGLVAVKYENKIVFYIGTAYQQKVPAGLSSYAMAGNYYTYNGNSYIPIDNSNISAGEDTVTISMGESSYTLSLWKPMGIFNDGKAFAGTLDGQEHTISGLFISDSSAQYQGLVGYNTGTVKNITLDNSFIYCGRSSGSCAGYNSGTIQNCTSNTTITGFYDGGVHGGICGENYGTVTQCINHGLVSTDYNGTLGGGQGGGIAGGNYGTVSASINYGTVWCGAAHVGGIVGYNRSKIEKCENYGAIGSSHNQVGGIAGNNNISQDYIPQINSCTNYGTVTITHTNTVPTDGNNIGGIAGALTGKGALIENCSNQGAVEGASYVGGIIGSMYNTSITNTVKECINRGQVNPSSSTINQIGGIVGEKRGTSPDINILSDCYYLIETISNEKMNSYGVCLSVNDGTFTSDSIHPNQFPVFVKKGHIFDGWYENKSFTGEAVTTPEAGKTYYAKWNERPVPVISFKDELNLDKLYDGNAVSVSVDDYTVTEGTGAVTFVYQINDGNDWKDIPAAPTNAGTYRVKAVVADNDSYKGEETGWKEFTISKANPTYTVPTDLTAVIGQTLADVKLPQGFTWQDAETTSVGELGTKTFKVTFTPEDTANYNIVTDIKVTLTVNPEREELNEVPAIKAEDKTLTVGDTFEPLKDVTAFDKEDGDLTKDIEVLSNDVDTSKAGSYTVTYKITDKNGASSTKTITVTVREKDTQTPGGDGSNPSEPDTDVLQTGDNSNIVLWSALLFVSAGAVLTLTLKRKRQNS